MLASIAACMALSATLNSLPPQILPAIQIIEGGRPGAELHNRNGSHDLGLMQINTLWLLPLSRTTGLRDAELRTKLLNDPCFNIAAAAAILSLNLRKTGGDLWRAVGEYHSHTPRRNWSYQGRVWLASRSVMSEWTQWCRVDEQTPVSIKASIAEPVRIEAGVFRCHEALSDQVKDFYRAILASKAMASVREWIGSTSD